MSCLTPDLANVPRGGLLCKSLLKLWGVVVSSCSGHFAYMAGFLIPPIFLIALVSVIYLPKGGSCSIVVIKIKLCAHSQQNLFSLRFKVVWLWALLSNGLYPKIQHLHWKSTDFHLCSSVCGRFHFTVKALETHPSSEEALEIFASSFFLGVCLGFTITSICLVSILPFSPTSLLFL